MAHTITEENGVFLIRVSGTLTMEVMGSCFTDMLTIMENNPGGRYLISYVDIEENQISAEEVRGLSQGINLNTEGPTTFKMAFVMAEDLEFGMGRLFVANIEENSSYAMFRDEESARSWLTG